MKPSQHQEQTITTSEPTAITWEPTTDANAAVWLCPDGKWRYGLVARNGLFITPIYRTRAEAVEKCQGTMDKMTGTVVVPRSPTQGR